MVTSQLVREYKVFTNSVKKPYELARTLSNGELIGKSYKSQKDGITIKELEDYIKVHHVEPKIE